MLRVGVCVVRIAAMGIAPVGNSFDGEPDA